MILTPAGGKLWRFKYRYTGYQKALMLGKYPDVSLAGARKLRESVSNPDNTTNGNCN